MLVGQICINNDAIEREILTPLLTSLIIQKDEVAINREAKTLKTRVVPAGVMFIVAHICGDDESYAKGTNILTVTGAGPNASPEAEKFALHQNGWSIPASPSRISANFTVI
jgi:hypothetical protein